MPRNAVLKIEHDTPAIYYLCVLNLGYRIVCPSISFWGGMVHIFHRVQIAAAKTNRKKNKKRSSDDGEEGDVCVC